jgi:hypothetical protein
MMQCTKIYKAHHIHQALQYTYSVYQCWGSGSGSGRMRNFLPDPDLEILTGLGSDPPKGAYY